MEDSEKRKQMLKAMRMEAAAAQNDDDSTSLETSMNTAHLSNPLAETSSHQQESNETQRFDYYTDPMSAYSSFKRNKSPKQQYASSPSHQISSPVPQFPPPAPGTLGSDYHPHTNHGGFQAPHISPSHRGSSPAAWNNNFRPPPFNNHLPPPPPHLAPYPFPYSQERPDNRYGGRGGGYYNNTAPPQFSNYGRPNSSWVGGGNTYPGPGRGRGRGCGSFGRDGGGRGRPMEQGAECFYSHSMVEDPWKYLKPVLWKSCSDGSSSKSWLPKSIAPKKPVLISESSQKPSNNNNKQSLAEYLAAALDEATACNDDEEKLAE